MALETIETRWAGQAARKLREPVPVHALPARMNPDRRRVYVPPAGIDGVLTVGVRVHHGVWQTECPFCPSAQHASPVDRLFYCGSCQNETAGRHALVVIWPDDPEEIERHLMERPDASTRNWEPGETVEQLAAENDHYLHHEEVA